MGKKRKKNENFEKFGKQNEDNVVVVFFCCF
jgi:hypothetical protein